MTGVPPLKWRAISDVLSDLLLLDYELSAAPDAGMLECPEVPILFSITS
jgi:hypothetical protein